MNEPECSLLAGKRNLSDSVIVAGNWLATIAAHFHLFPGHVGEVVGGRHLEGKLFARIASQEIGSLPE